MLKLSSVRSWCVSMTLLALLGAAAAQSEPSIDQIYQTARSGQLDEAQVMIQQVLVAHPGSAKAHYVRAELYARQGQLSLAQQSLTKAEQLSPGLPFANANAVQALKSEISRGAPAHAGSSLSVSSTQAASAGAGGNWALPVLLAGAVMVLGFLMFRRQTPGGTAAMPTPTRMSVGGPSGLSGPQTFGAANSGSGLGAGATYGAGAYAPAPATSLGSRVMGGVATGLAVGAGVVAAEAIGRSLMGSHATQADPLRYHDPAATLSGNDWGQVNAAMGSADFGINDTNSWDNAGDVGSDIGGDWDS